MIHFECDYTEGAHPKILKMLEETNFEQTPGYGQDEYCSAASKRIKELCLSEDADVHFLIGGTQTNMIVISSVLRPHQGVISAHTGHINVHETGAIEATGHRVIAIHSNDGKITARQVQEICEAHYNDENAEHTVQPGMVYISNPTENGTIYSKEELSELSKVCKRFDLPLYMDGARMGYGLMAHGNDLTLPDIARLCDAFYIGGTKVGAMFGEAVVITNPSLQKDFRYFIKQRGGLLAKGRILGIQFAVLFENNLYFEIAQHAVNQAMLIKRAFEKKGYSFFADTCTNQIFPILPNEIIEKLAKKYSFYIWDKTDETNSAIRLCTSWATKDSHVDELISDINSI